MYLFNKKMSRIRELLVAGSQATQGEIISYIPIFKYKCKFDIDIIKIQSRSQAGAIVLLCDYLKTNKIIDLYLYMDESLREWELESDMSSDEKLDYLICYLFESGSGGIADIQLKKEKRTVLLSDV